MTSKTTVMEFYDIVVYYGKLKVIDGITLRIPEGITLIIGSNGSGKSTLIKTGLGLLRPKKGKVRLLGYDPFRDKAVYRLVSYVPDFNPIHPQIKVSTYLDFLEHFYGKRVWIEARELKLLDHKNKRYHELSTGLRRRLALVEALASRRPVIIIDEPFLGLDVASRRLVSERLIEIANNGSNYIIISHITIPKAQIDNLIIMDAGKIEYAGPYDENKASKWLNI